MERWPSGRRRFTANEVYLKQVPRVRIPASPPKHVVEILMQSHINVQFRKIKKLSKLAWLMINLIPEN